MFTDGFWCHACATGGDLFTLCQQVEDVPFEVALDRLASMAGILASAPDDTEAAIERERRRQARAAREASQRRRAGNQRRTAQARAPAVWHGLARRSPAGLAYLCRRGVAAVAREVRFGARSACIPLRQLDGTITNVVGRRLDGRDPKVAGLRHASTAGMFGDPRKLAVTDGPVIIVEGVFDWLSARVLSPRRLVLGAHGAARLPDVARAAASLATDRGLVFVPHRDRIGQQHVAIARAAAVDAGVPSHRIDVFEVAPECGDLNDHLVRRYGRTDTGSPVRRRPPSG